VDDEESILNVFRLFFKQYENINYHEAVSGEAGIVLAKQINPNLVIMDYKLPGISGWVAARKIKDECINEPIILGYSAYVNEIGQQKKEGAVCTEIIIKPYPLEMFTEKIKNYLDL
jgi:CheY-like chemotaxis protein